VQRYEKYSRKTNSSATFFSLTASFLAYLYTFVANKYIVTNINLAIEYQGKQHVGLVGVG
jgi:hypothetical protein